MKKFPISLLLIATVFGTIMLTGCDEGMKMMEPVMDKPMPPDMDPEPPMDMEKPMPPDMDEKPPMEDDPEMTEVPKPVRPGEEPLSVNEADRKAENVLVNTIQRMLENDTALLTTIEDEGGDITDEKYFNMFFEDTKRILFEETGVTWEQSIHLIDIILETHPLLVLELYITMSQERLINLIPIAYYLRITYVYPEKTEEEILGIFRKQVGSDTDIFNFILIDYHKLVLPVPSPYLYYPDTVFNSLDTELSEYVAPEAPIPDVILDVGE